MFLVLLKDKQNFLQYWEIVVQDVSEGRFAHKIYFLKFLSKWLRETYGK